MTRKKARDATATLRARVVGFVRIAWLGLAICMLTHEVGAQGQNVQFVGQIGGACYAVAVQGNYAYIGEGSNLTILNISTPARPTVVGRIRLPGIVQGIAVSGGLAYVADGGSGLQIIDVSNPSSPELRGAYDTPGAAGTWSQIAAVGPNVRTYQNTRLAAATTYYYRVCACNAGGNSIWSNVASATTHPTLDVKTWPLYR